MERTQPQPDRSGGQSVQSRSPAASSSSGAAGLLKQTESQISSPTQPETLPRIKVADLPPLPESVGLDRLLQRCFGAPLRPLRVLWPVARWLWLAVGLIVIGAAAIDYLSDLFTGGLPDVTGSFFHSPVLEIPSRYPHRFMAAAAAALFLTTLTWGAAREQRRLVNARAKQVGQLLRAGVVLEQLDEDVFARLAAGDFYATFLLATHLHEQNRPEDAAALYHLLLKKTPKHFGVQYNLGLICAESGRFEAAEDHCRTAILLSPESAEAQGLLAYVLYRLGELAEAQRRARLAVRMGFSSKLLEALILPGLGVTSSLPTVETGEGQ